MGRFPAEDDVQAAVVGYLRRVLPGALVWSTPNEGRRTVAERGRLLRLGMRAGVADLCCLTSDGRILFFECKSRDGRLTPAQLAFAVDVQNRSALWACVRSIDDVRAALNEWGVPHRDRSAA